MPNLLLAAVEYGGYISIFKLVIFVILFLLWLPVLSWINKDAQMVGAKVGFWTALALAAPGAGVLFWLIGPVFFMGMLIYIIALAAVSVPYVLHRDKKVSQFQQIVSIDTIKNIFQKAGKELESLENLIFITSRNTNMPLPEPRTHEFLDYKFAHDTLKDALWRRASDISFVPAEDSYMVVYYIDGAAVKQPSVSRDQAERFIHFVKNLAGLSSKEKRKPQKGKFRINQKPQNTTEWQAATAGSTVGEQLRLKRIETKSIQKLNEIGLPPDLHEKLNKVQDAKQGVFLIAGPAKSGVTTTFYAMLRNHDPFMYVINTIEREPSADLINVTQNTFSLSDTGTSSYTKKLQTIIETNPDIVGVTDCNEAETAKLICRAAGDGKIVYVTIQADNVIKAVGRWLQLVGDKELAVGNLLGISSQRLIRKLCEQCKQAYGPKKELLKKFNVPAEKAKVLYRAEKTVHEGKRGKAKVCNICQGTGYLGRFPVFEVITLDDDLRNFVKRASSLSDISTQFRRAKMLYLQEQALKKVIAGQTSINEMVRILSSAKKRKAKSKKPKA